MSMFDEAQAIADLLRRREVLETRVGELDAQQATLFRVQGRLDAARAMVETELATVTRAIEEALGPEWPQDPLDRELAELARDVRATEEGTA